MVVPDPPREDRPGDPPASLAVAEAVAPVVHAVPLVADEARQRTYAEVVRLTGILQLSSGFFNIFVMSLVQCLGLGMLGGLPGCFAGLLLAVGIVEVLSGVQALVYRNPHWIRPTALLEVLSLAAMGVLSAAVGMLVLFVRKRYPAALP